MNKDQILSTVYLANPTHPSPVLDQFQPTKILILLPESTEWTEEKAYLIKMFEAAILTYGTDFSIVRIPAGSHISWVELLRATSAKDVYLFGIHPQQLGLQSNLIPGLPVLCGDILIFRTDVPLKVKNNEHIRSTLWKFFQKRYLKNDNNAD